MHGSYSRSDCLVHGVFADSRTVAPGYLFAALPGAHVHGAKFAACAVERGAVAILTDAEGLLMLQADGVEVPVIVDPAPAQHLGAIAAKLYGEPAAALRTFAVTGTNGKTTTTFLLDHLLGKLSRCTGLIGTVEIRLGDDAVPAHLTTPQPADLQAMLAQLRAAGGNDMVMEVSSHALTQGRTDPICYSVAGFTNLSQDHLDFHHNMDAYFDAKASLFTPQKAQRAVICVDDDWGRRLFNEVTIPATALAVHSDLGGRPGWQVDDLRLGKFGEATRFVMRRSDGASLELATSLPASFNVANLALAVAMLIEGGVSVEAARQAIGECVNVYVPGRMEIVSQRPQVVVDFAHNVESLDLVLTSLRAQTHEQLIVVTGSAGDRDREKRTAMGHAVASGADVVIITDDDPHSEDPAQIRAALLAGTRTVPNAVVHEIDDRSEAIRAAIKMAGPDDIVLIAGRGHEAVQAVGDAEIKLDDRQVAREAVQSTAVSAPSASMSTPVPTLKG